MQSAERLKTIPPSLFTELRQRIGQARAADIDVIDLAVGDPVEPTPDEIIRELARTAYDPANHQYPTDAEAGMRTFREAVGRWYAKRYGVIVDPQTEIVALIGSKEGCHHFALACVNPGSPVLITDPGHPTYRASILIAGGEPVDVAIRPEHGYRPVLRDIPSDVARQATAMFLNYPNNPTGAVATPAFLKELVDFARNYDIAVCYDNPCIEVVFDGEAPLSFLSVPGAKDIGVELSSLSKSFNMTGWRIGMALGNPDLIAAISKVKEHTDSGIFNAIQYAGIAAFTHCEDHLPRMQRIYARRRNLVIATLSQLGIKVPAPKGTVYVWAPAPWGVSSFELADTLLDKARVAVAPGRGYGDLGEGFFRISLTVTDGRLGEAMERVRQALTT